MHSHLARLSDRYLARRHGRRVHMRQVGSCRSREQRRLQVRHRLAGPGFEVDTERMRHAVIDKVSIRSEKEWRLCAQCPTHTARTSGQWLNASKYARTVRKVATRLLEALIFRSRQPRTFKKKCIQKTVVWIEHARHDVTTSRSSSETLQDNCCRLIFY